MRQLSWSGGAVCSERRVLHLAGFVAGLCVLFAVPAAAQDIAADRTAVEDFGDRLPQESAEICRVFAGEVLEGGAANVFAGCKGRGFALGPATRYAVIQNEALQAVVVDMWLGDERRVWLLSLQEDGQALFEDVTGSLAYAAGRGVRAELAGVDLDLARFAREGGIGVRARPEDRGSAKAEWVDLGDQVTRERARRRGNRE